jgi:hypothetical protein
MTRAEELEAIDAFVAARGVTRCPTRYVLSTNGHLSMAEAAQRLVAIKVRSPRTYAWVAIAQRVLMAWTGRR